MQIRYSNVGTTEPITAAEVKAWLKVDFSDEDTLIGSLITQVRELAEEASGLALIDKTIEYFEEDRDIIGDWVKLPYPAHNAITAVVLDGETLTTDDYSVTGLTQKLIKITGTVTVDDTLNDNGLKVTYTTEGTCPNGVKIAMLKEIAETYEKRGNTFEGSLVALTSNFYNYLSQFKSY
jgi:uncharacterized phiE125 gp8 family phage protein